MSKVDFGKLTEDETAALATEALGELTLDKRVQAVLKAFDAEAQEELASWLDTDDDEEKTTTA